MSYPRLGSKNFRNPASFEDWREFLVEHRAPPSPPEKPEFGGPFGFAMQKRWDWLQDALARGIPFQEAEQAFSDAVDRARGKEQASSGEPNARASRRAQRDDGDALVEHAKSLGL
jgi:hypothetical protein